MITKENGRMIMRQTIYTRTLFLSKEETAYIHALRNLPLPEIEKKYGTIKERAFYQKVAFTKEIDAEISIFFQDGKYRTNGYLHEKHYVDEDISNIPCIKSSADFMGMWKFLYDRIEYVLFIMSEEDL